MASLIGGMSSTEGEVERSRSAQGLLENRNGSEVMVFNERVMGLPADGPECSRLPLAIKSFERLKLGD